jgi:soluble lytic murein transglycosylase
MTAWWRAIFTAILIALPLAAAAAGGTSQDKALLAARDAFLAGDRVKLARHAEKIGSHALDSYVAFWRLRMQLEETDPGEVREFLTRNEGSVLAEQLRRDWLLVLGKNGQWEMFREASSAPVKPDPDVACYALQERWRRQDAAVFAEVKPFFMAPQALPSGCAPVVDAMLFSGELTPRDLRDRFRLLVQANLMAEARRIAERLPSNQAPSGVQIENAATTPAKFLERTDGDLNTAAGRELALVALTRLARSDPRRASGFWNGSLWERFSPEDRQYAWGMLATSGARHHLPEAVEWFKKAGETPLSDEQLAWRARIALRQENWPEVKRAIEKMSPAAQDDAAWIYWLGRSLIALGAQEGGRALWDRISGEHHYYGRLAAEEMGQLLQIPKKAATPTREEIAEVAALAGMQRALALYRLGLRTEALTEWLWTVRNMSDRALLAAAELAKVNGLWDRAINTAARTVAEHDFTLRYLAPHGPVLSEQARSRKLDESLVFGLVRQESRFIADAKSSAGASGLMQLMPSTAQWMARKIGMKGFNASRLEQPEVNATLGAYYLRHVLDGFGGNQVLAAAAYNAGPGRARRWCDVKPLEGAIYVETIPFVETRQYVKRVMENAIYYAAVMSGEQRSLKSCLGMIEGAVAVKTEADE